MNASNKWYSHVILANATIILAQAKDIFLHGRTLVYHGKKQLWTLLVLGRLLCPMAQSKFLL
jgi:hypothetical protein